MYSTVKQGKPVVPLQRHGLSQQPAWWAGVGKMLHVFLFCFVWEKCSLQQRCTCAGTLRELLFREHGVKL